MVSMSSSKALVEYAIRQEHLNNVLNNKKVKDPIDSSQLSYVKPKEIQVNRANNYKNRACAQQDNENLPALNFSPT